MQFKLAVIAAVIAAFVPTALAAECYNASGCKQCESETSMYDARQAFCGSNDWQGSSSMSWGYALVTLEGAFHSQQDCYDGFANIITDCYGREDGGVYTYYGRLDVDFCDCE